jgi:patatin-like phospholipase/acyl hydrolase
MYKKKNMGKTDKFKLLCIDGGGIKGLHTEKLLAILEVLY